MSHSGHVGVGSEPKPRYDGVRARIEQRETLPTRKEIGAYPVRLRSGC